MSRLRSNRTLHAFVFTVIFISLMIIGSSSWLIIYPTDTDTSTETPPDTSPYFISEIDSFDGKQHVPVPTPEGIEIFGTNGKYERNEEKGATTGYTLKWNKTVLRDDRYYFTALDSTLGSAYAESLEAMKGCVAGTHYYEIVDNATGQVISKNHVLTIKPVTFTVEVGQGPVFTTADKPYVSITMTADDGKATITHKHSFTRDNYVATTAIGYTYQNTGNVVPVNTVKNIVPDMMSINATAVNMNNYAVPTTYDLNVTLLPTVKATATGKYYADLVQALGAETSGKVIPLQSFTSDKIYTSGTDYNHVIDANCTIASGVTLYIPFDTSESWSTSRINNVTYHMPTQACSTGASSYNDASKQANVVKVCDGVTVMANGVIHVAGNVSGAQNSLHGSGLTNGVHSQITLGADSKIEAYNDIYCYGFIDGFGNGSYVKMNSGNMVVVYTVVEHRGGAVYLSTIGGVATDGVTGLGGQQGMSNALNKMPDLVSAPFNRFYIRSVTSNLIVPASGNGGGKVTGYADLDAYSDHNVTMVNLVGNANDGTLQLLELDPGSRIECTFNPDLDTAFEGEYGKNILNVYGSADLNALSLTVSAKGLIDVTLSTDKVYFPISHYWKITLNRIDESSTAVLYSAAQDIKLLPGAELTVGPGVTLQVDGEIAVYSTEDAQYLVESGTGTREYHVTTAAVLNVAGTLYAYGLGGTVNPIGADAKLVINEASVTIKEINTTTINGKVIYSIGGFYDQEIGDNVWIVYHSADLSANGNVYTGGEVALMHSLTAGQEYAAHSYVEVVDGKEVMKYAWRQVSYANLTYVSNGGTAVASQTLPYWSDEVVSLSSITLPTPTLTNCDFVGWYTDPSCNETYSASKAILSGDMTLYAKWKIDIHFEYSYDETFTTSPSLNPPDDITVYLTGGSAALPTVSTAYSFVGWFVDNADWNDTGKIINEINASVVKVLKQSDGKCVVYGRWTQDARYTITYISNDSIYATVTVPVEESTVLLTPTLVGYRFIAWYDAEGNKIGDAGASYTPTSDTTLYARWVELYTINYNANGGSVSVSTVDIDAGSSTTLPTPTRANYKFLGWYTTASGETKVGDAGASYTPSADITLYAHWQGYTVTYNANNGSCDTSSQTYEGTALKLPSATRDGYTFDGWYTKASGGTEIGDAGANYTPTSDITLYAHWTKNSDGCVTPDTLITLADGTQVRVDSLKGDEMLLVWNLETGKLDIAPIMFVDSELEAEFEVIKLIFSDGTEVKVIYEHGFWDYDLNKYVYLDRNASEYIGHSFAKQNGDALERVVLVDVQIETVLTTAWSPVTVGHLCYFVNGMLSMPGGVGGLFNIFDVDAETMTYDYEAMERDIATYGLYTYEELNAIAPLSREMFEAAGGAYLKISIGKGNLTEEELIYMIERYSCYFE